MSKFLFIYHARRRLAFAKEHSHLNSPGCEIEVHEAQQIPGM